MAMTILRRSLHCIAGLAALVVWCCSNASAQPPKDVKERAWTLDEAMAQLRLYPRDAYLQYVALQLTRRETVPDTTMHELERMIRGTTQPGEMAREEGVNLFSLFSGSLAIQESLQLDAMRDGASAIQRTPPAAQPAGAPQNSEQQNVQVKVKDLTGPTIQSHPWKELLGGKKPEVSSLARFVPADFYFAEVRSISRLLKLFELNEVWGQHAFSQSQRDARSQLAIRRVQKQLAVVTNPLLGPVYDEAIEELAITGSDLFLREGSDVTLLFQVRRAEPFKLQMDQFLRDAMEGTRNVRRSEGTVHGIPFVHLSTSDRAVHVFSAYPSPALHVRSNSRVAFERVLAMVQKKAEGTESLGDSTEFAYMRSLMPRGATEEDGFIYLSDPFIRRLIGPELKLTERRRVLCYNHLRMIGHAVLMYSTEHGRSPASLDELAEAKCTPESFNSGSLTCPDGGKYSLSEDRLSGVCSHHGHSHWLTPCCEIPVTEVSRVEADQYQMFLNQYNQYWRRFFDPIGVRVQVAPKQYRFETIILPLIDNSIYTSMANLTSGPPDALDQLPVPERNIFTLALRLNKNALLEQAGLPPLEEGPPEKKAPARSEVTSSANNLRQIGLGFLNFHDTYRHMPSAAAGRTGRGSGLSWRVHLLPFLGYLELYDQFKQDEPWDSEHNKALIARMPAVFASSNRRLTESGKTRFVAPLGNDTALALERPRLADFTDGTSNTILIVEADDEHAVVWTRPEDLQINNDRPTAGLARHAPGGVLLLYVDGSVKFLRDSIAAPKMLAMLTRAGNEAAPVTSEDQLPLQLPRARMPLGPFGFRLDVIESLDIGPFLARGIGDYIAFHVYDTEPLFAFSLPRFLGMSLGNFRNRSNLLDGELGLSLLIASLNSPIYISMPVRDAAIVDRFLERLDQFLATSARQDWGAGWFAIDTDFYNLPPKAGTQVRAYGFQIGPVKWRFFWARIGQGLYVASQPGILDDLKRLDAATKPAPAAGQPKEHGLVRIRANNWSRVLPSFQLGWAENNREACFHNLGPLASMNRASPASESDTKELARFHQRLAERVYDAHFFCPEGGHYHADAGGKQVTCSVHGSATAPLQPAAPAAKSEMSRQLATLGDARLTLTFLEDGLHAVAVIIRKDQ